MRSGIAIIGMAGRFPGAHSVEAFWRNLCDGVNSIVMVDRARLLDAGVDAALIDDPKYVPAASFIDHYDCFDAEFFGIRAADAQIMDPQHRLMLEMAYNAFEAAGYVPGHIDARVGVFAGAGGVVSSQLLSCSSRFGEFIGRTGGEWHLGNDKDFVATRVSYKLDLLGPSLTVQTACSTSLVALHLACQSLRAGECEMALAGAGSIRVPQRVGYVAESGGIYSSSGRMRAFDDQADGVVFGSGIGFVLLKPVERALADGDPVLALIRSTAINNDGGQKMSFMATRLEGQVACVTQALRDADVPARSIGFVESHGTGTAMGDPIEVAALTQAFRDNGAAENGFCFLGAVKNNIGHLDIAAGIASVIKAVLCLRHARIPPCIHFSQPNRRINLQQSPFRINTKLQDWIAGETPRRAAVNCLGIGGTNAFAILEEAPSPEQRGVEPSEPHLIVISARNQGALSRRIADLAQWLELNSAMQLRDVAVTLSMGRSHHNERCAILADDCTQLREKLTRLAAGRRVADAFEGSRLVRHEFSAGIIEFARQTAATLAQTVDIEARRTALRTLADLYCQGLELEFAPIFVQAKARRVALPGYAFERRPFALPLTASTTAGTAQSSGSASARLHPLLQRNVSDLLGVRYETSFDGGEAFLRDHVIEGECVLPGAAQLEMAAAALQLAQPAVPSGAVLRLEHVIWTRPIRLSEGRCAVALRLQAMPDGGCRFRIINRDADAAGGELLHAQGESYWRDASSTAVPRLDVDELRARLTRDSHSVEQRYAQFQAHGLSYGPTFRVLREIYFAQDAVLARLDLGERAGDFLLPPALVDAALQASMVLSLPRFDSALLPFTLDALTLHAPVPASVWAWVRASQTTGGNASLARFDIGLYDDDGRCVLQLDGYVARGVRGAAQADATDSPTTHSRLLLEPVWQMRAPVESPQRETHRKIFLLGWSSKRSAALFALWDDVIASPHDASLAAHEAYADAAEALASGLRELFVSQPAGPLSVQVLVREDILGLPQMGGMLRTAQLENTRLHAQLICVSEACSDTELFERAEAEARNDAELVRYAGDRREVMSLSELPVPVDAPLLWKDSGVYWVVGGAGGLGLLVAREVAARTQQAVLILSGRSVPDAALQARLNSLSNLGLQVEYHAVDVTDAPAMRALALQLRDTHGRIDGVILAAGVLRDRLISQKDVSEFRSVLAPKVAGAIALDEATRDMPLEFFLLFSSLTSVAGNAGQIDYAAANGFLDAFAAQRQAQVVAAERAGRTLAINWPLWADGGMRLDAASERLLTQRFGMVPLTTTAAFAALREAFAARDVAQVIVFEGELARLRNHLEQAQLTNPNKTRAQPTSGTWPVEVIERRLLDALLQDVAQLLEVGTDALDPDAELAEYGFDSIGLTSFANALNDRYGLRLLPSLFFELSTLGSMAAGLAREHCAVLGKHFGLQPEKASAPAHTQFLTTTFAPVKLHGSSAYQSAEPSGGDSARVDTGERVAVAIVGASGRFPKALDLEELWRNLLDERDCIEEIPPSRWDWRAVFGDPHVQKGCTNIKWGGFIEGVDEFDPLFFGISPHEARLMDPHQRLVMLHGIGAIEDAGYAPSSLAGSNMGVFVGTSASGYAERVVRGNVVLEAYSSTGAVPSVGPNRLSFFLDVNGPSEAIETACSSSLVAIDRAVQYLQQTEGVLALAGGVNTLVTPDYHISFSQAGMLSEDGRCKTFSDRANGYVRGEGVGMVLLKRLSEAEAAGDCIYGVIRASAVNHGGRANSLTAPNPKAQAALLQAAYRRAGIDVRTVSYIEAHGTGTELGDPVEVNALKSAFAHLYEEAGAEAPVQAHCGLGTVKSNIGHLELAAGIAGLIKVLLQLKHRTLVKSLHCERLNPYIDLSGSPFYIVQQSRPWEALRDAHGAELPRRAGVSSFGFGGANAHVVIEEYVERRALGLAVAGPVAIVLSGKGEERLREQAQRLRAVLDQFSDGQLCDVAYTLQVGRDALSHRLALIANSCAELQNKLDRYLVGEHVSEVYSGIVRRNRGALARLDGDADLQRMLGAWWAKGRLDKVLALWAEGLEIDWAAFYAGRRVRRMRLPAYPFARESYWVDAAPQSPVVVQSTPAVAPLKAADHEDELLYLRERWEPNAASLVDAPLPSTVVVFGELDTQTLPPTTRLVRVEDADTFADRGDDRYALRWNQSEDYDALFSRLTPGTPLAILDRRAERHPDRSLEASFHLLRALHRARMAPAHWVASGSADDGGGAPLFEALIGMQRTLALLLPQAAMSLHLGDSAALESSALVQTLRAVPSIYRCRGTKRESLQIERIELPATQSSVFNPEGVYWIAGSSTGLGALLAEYLAARYRARLLLSGRRAPDAQIRARLESLRAHGAADVVYEQADITDSAANDAVVERALQRWGRIDGVFHCAGIFFSDAAVDTDWSAFASALAAKVDGTTALDHCTRALPLDFFCCFSSIAALLGDFGSVSYAAGNRFQTAFCAQRNAQARQGQRRGFALALHWPWWREGGMSADPLRAQLYLRSSGQRALERNEGWAVLEAALQTRVEQLAVAVGERLRIESFFANAYAGARRSEITLPVRHGVRGKAYRAALMGVPLEHCVALDLRQCISRLSALDAERTELDVNLAELGFDSIGLTHLARDLSEHFSLELTPSLFFGHPTIERIAAHLTAAHREHLTGLYAPGDASVSVATLQVASLPRASTKPDSSVVNADEPIAVIGLVGRFPAAADIDSFWQLLAAERDAIKEIPADRWDWRQLYFGPDAPDNLITSPAGAFLDGIGEFDPLFFSLSPHEAEEMDPRQRLMLQTAWHAFEDAGYAPEYLRGSKCGVFIGVEEGDYGNRRGSEGLATSNHSAILAARISYHLDLRGLNLAINTACSSSLVALHQACEAIRRRECELALVGGVNLLLSAGTYLSLTRMGMLSPSGACRTFSDAADGMVPGEAVVAVVLKPLSCAQADADRVVGLIRATGVNYDGKTNGLTVPSGAAQHALLDEVYGRFGIDVERIGYVVAHGTATRLGDPVEVEALSAAFRTRTSRVGYCALGSVKTRVGHSFGASGLVSVSAALLALRERVVPASLHCARENEHIRFADSPFYVVRQTQAWNSAPDTARLAAVSAFGMSGTNAHVVLEEYMPPAAPRSAPPGPYLLTLSARTEAQLRAYAARLQEFFGRSAALALAELCYTFQVGREGMRHRAAFVVEDAAQLRADLARLANGEPLVNGLRGECSSDNRVQQLFTASAGMRATLQGWLIARELSQLARVWVEGVEIDWRVLHGGTPPARIAAPLYPFAREHYWLPPAEGNVLTSSRGREALRLAERRESRPTLQVRRFETVATREGEAAFEHSLLIPGWRALDRTFMSQEAAGEFPLNGGGVLVVAQARDWREIAARLPDAQHMVPDAHLEIGTLRQRLQRLGTIRHLVWIAPGRAVGSVLDAQMASDADALIGGLFRWIKALLLDNAERHLAWTVITCDGGAVFKSDVVNPAHAGVLGLIGSMAKECGAWPVRVADRHWGEPFPLEQIRDLPRNTSGEVLAWREGRWWQPCLRLAEDRGHGALPLRQRGVYVVFGGAGGIGRAWSEAMVRRFDAQLIWVGRSALTDQLRHRIAQVARYGRAPDYLQADLGDAQTLAAVRDHVHQRFGRIDGVLHSAVGELDRSLAAMDEEHFARCLRANVSGSVNLARVFADELLDFLLFFSTLVAFSKDHGKSAYVAGSQFKNACAYELDRTLISRARAMSWGWWELGIAADVPESFRRRIEQSGVGPIQIDAAMEALETLLTGASTQCGLLRATQAGLDRVTERKAGRVVLLPRQATVPHAVLTTLPLPVLEALQLEPGIEGITHELDAAMARLLASKLCILGMFDREDCAFDELAKVLVPRYRPWLHRSLELLVEQGLVVHANERFSLTNAQTSDSARPWSDWQRQREEWMRHDAVQGVVELVERTLEALPEVLTGRRLATDVLFPDASVAGLEKVYRSAPGAGRYHTALAESMTHYLRKRNSHAASSARIIEIGAGTGGTSAVVLQRLREAGIAVSEYCYTDVSRAFLMHAQDHFGPQYPYLSCRLLDIEKDPLAQGFGAGEFNVVVAANVLHATRDIRTTLRNAKRLLRSGGLLVLNELSTAGGLFAQLTFGLTEDWWRCEDATLRIPGSPALEPGTWERVLKGEGFPEISFPAQAYHAGGQFVVAAISDGELRLDAEAHREAHAQISAPASEPEHASPQTDREDQIVEHIINALATSMRLPRESIETDRAFADYGVDSILGVNLVRQLNRVLGIDLPTTSLFEHRTVAGLAALIVAEFGERVSLASPAAPAARAVAPTVAARTAPGWSSQSSAVDSLRDESARGGIAVVGLSCRFAQSEDARAFWKHLAAGDDLVAPVSRWDLSAYEAGAPAFGALLDDIDRFDPGFFNISGREAEYMDLQQRFVLMECWRALEDAGYAGESTRGRECGVFIGCSTADYAEQFEWGRGQPAQAVWGNSTAVIPVRISYYLDLKGPAIAIDTACSSSLVALHLACQSLSQHETNMALAGGVHIHSGPGFFLALSGAGMLAPSGRCHTFDARADGFVPGEGVGVLVLKRLEDALAHGDQIYGVVRGSGINQDGATNGLIAPNMGSQETLQAGVYRRYGIDPGCIQLVEAHGTGTVLGDPIEVKALTRAFHAFTSQRQYCALGSVKTNIGHTAPAAGIAGAIKVLLALRHRQMPPSLHCRELNPNIDFASTPFFVNTSLRTWRENHDSQGRRVPRLAAINSFGLSGTNAHVVIEEAPSSERRSAPREAWLFVLSARSEERLREQAKLLCDAFDDEPTLDPGHVSYTLVQGRRHLPNRLAFAARDVGEAAGRLREWLSSRAASAVSTGVVREKAREARCGDVARLTAALRSWEGVQRLAEHYVRGGVLPVEDLFDPAECARVSLPSQPFTLERYWIPDAERSPRYVSIQSKESTDARSTEEASPLRYLFEGQEAFLADHCVDGCCVLPGVLYLELARSVAARAFTIDELRAGRKSSSFGLRNVVWRSPATAGTPDQPASLELIARVQAEHSEGAEFLIEAADGNVYCQGRLQREPAHACSPRIDLAAVRARCARTFAPAELYARYAQMAMEYGREPSHRYATLGGHCRGLRAALGRCCRCRRLFALVRSRTA